MSLTDRILAGDRLALARLVTWIENGEPRGEPPLAELYPHTGNAQRVGITGSSGTGKSTLVNQLALLARRDGWPAPARQSRRQVQVGIVAVDPSSPFTGGAILGDRIRMRDLAGDPGVFIRSMASRGVLGGLARNTASVVQVLDAAGFDLILIETVGAGQTEVDIARTAHTTVVVEAPGLGDEIQAIKAGILEIADILVVNKADLPGADQTLAALRTALDLAGSGRPGKGGEAGDEDQERWRAPLVKTVATDGQGAQELAEAIGDHWDYLQSSGQFERRERQRIEYEVGMLLREMLAERFLERQPDGLYDAALERVLDRRVSPRQAVVELIQSGETTSS